MIEVSVKCINVSDLAGTLFVWYSSKKNKKKQQHLIYPLLQVNHLHM